MSQPGRDSRTEARISLPAFRHNLGVVRTCVGTRVNIMAVVKANAYGHGAGRLAAEAVQWGVEYLGVARVGEGVALREEGIGQQMLVFELVTPGHEQLALENELELTIAGTETAERINDAAGRLKKKARVHVKVDTGMGRLGMDHKRSAMMIESFARLRWLELAGIYSHFATSDRQDVTFAREQLQRFQTVLEELERRKIDVGLRHMANSGAILAMPESHFDMVRPGIMLYGYAPRRDMRSDPPLQPVLSLISHVAFLKSVEANTSISYGQRYFTREETMIATIPIGYADGYFRLLTGKGEAIINGVRHPVVGTVCMDYIMVDLGSKSDVREGDEVILVGRTGTEVIDCWDIGEKIGTIPYEVTCLISGRIPRVFQE